MHTPPSKSHEDVYCTRCGAKSSVTHNFCAQCGSQLPVVESASTNTSAATRNRSSAKATAKGCLVGFLAIVLLGICGSAFSGNNKSGSTTRATPQGQFVAAAQEAITGTPSSTPTDQPTAVPTIRPSNTPEPTSTPAPTSTTAPTSTPVPTNTPQPPTATPEPTVDVEKARIQACGDEIRAGVATAGATLQAMGELLKNAKPNSASWVKAVRKETQKLRTQDEQAEAKPYYDTPEGCRKAYNLYLSGLYPLVEMADKIEQFLDTGDTSNLDEAVERAKSGNRYMGQAIEELDRITR